MTTGTTTRGPTRPAIAALVIVAAVAGCTEPASDPGIPLVNTSAMEAPVRSLIEAVTRNLEGAPDSAVAWGRLGRVYHAHDLDGPALACYEKAMQLEPGNFHWPYLAAHAIAETDKTAAVAYFDKARQLVPADDVLLVAYGNVLTQLGRDEAAGDAFRAALDANGRSSFAHVGLAQQSLLQGNLESARSLLEQARELAPTDGSIYSLLTQVYARLGDSEQASRSELLARVHDKPRRPRDPVIRAMRALAANSHAYASEGARLADEGDLAAAEARLRKVLAIRPGTPTDFGNLATVLSRQGKHGEAMELFAKGLADNPDAVILLSHQGLTQMRMGDIAAAEESLTRAANLDSAYPQAQFNLGVLRYGQGRHRDAITCFERTLALDPGFTDAYLNLGSAYAALGEFEAALQPWEQLRQIQSDNAALVHNIALANARLDRLDQAVADFRRAIDLDPDNAASRRELERTLRRARTLRRQESDGGQGEVPSRAR